MNQTGLTVIASSQGRPPAPSAGEGNLPVIVIRRPKKQSIGIWREFIVWIDGKIAGEVKHGVSGEFVVEPGQHYVFVSMDWARSSASHVVLGPSSRTELVIGDRWGMFVLKVILPIYPVLLLSFGLMKLFLAMVPVLVLLRMIPAFALDNGLLPIVFLLAMSLVIYFGYVVATSLFMVGYWTLFRLSPDVPHRLH